MKQNLLKKLWLRVCMLVAVILCSAGTAWGDDYVLYSGTITEGDYLIVYDGAAMKAAVSSNRLQYSEVTITNNTISDPNADLIWTITKDNVETAYYKLYNAYKGQYAASTGTKNQATLTTTIDKKIRWTITGTTTYEFVNQQNSSNSINANLRKNGTYGFACYSTSTGGALSLYKKVEGSSPTETCATPTFSPAAGVYLSAQDVTINCETSGASIYYSYDNENWAEYTSTLTVDETKTIYAKAEMDGMDNSSVATATYTILEHAGTQADPYTVADARAAIDAGSGITSVYATGVVTAIPTPYDSGYGNITFNFVDEEGDTEFLQAYRCTGTDAADVRVGDIVVVSGDLTRYNSTYEFGQGCTLVSLTHPAAAVADPTFSPVAGTYAEAQNVTISCETSDATIYYTTDGTQPTSASTQYSNAIPVSTATTIKAIAIKGSDESLVATASYHICSADDPYTVTEALAFSEYPANGIYVHGIVSTAPTQSPTNNGELTYYISVDGEATNQLEVYKGKGLEQAAFTAQDDIQVGDIVTIYGNVKIYNSTKEFDTGNYLVSFERPVVTTPAINASNVTIAHDATSGSITYTIDNPVEGTSLTATTDVDWISDITVDGQAVTFTTTANEGNTDRTATFTLSYAGAEDVTVTVTQGHFEVDYAILPFEWEGGASSDLKALTGVTASVGSDYAAGNAPYLVKFDGTGKYIQVKTDSQPGKVTIGVKMIGGAATSKITVQGSSDGETFTDVQELTISGAQNTELTLETTNAFAATDRYVRLYFTKGSNVGVGPITIAKPTTDPAINADDAVNLAADATSGEIEYNIVNPITGTSLTAASEAEWISNIIVETSTVTFTTTANTGDERIGTITLTYGSLTKDVTVTQAAYVAPPTPGNWVLTSLADLTSNDIFVIVGTDSDTGNSYALPNNGGTNAPSAVSVTIYENTLSGDIAEELQWNISGNATDGYTFYPNGDSESWLYCTNSNNGVRVGTNDNKTFTLDSETGYLKHEATSRYIGIYNSQDWRCYTNTTGNIADQTFTFYKKVEETPTITITLNGDGYATFSSNQPLDFTDSESKGYTAWQVTGVEGTSINFAQINGAVAAGTGVLLKGTADGKITPTFATIGDDISSTNKLVAITEATDIEAYQYYGLSGKTFVKVKAGKVKAGKALLPANVVESAGGDVKTLSFDFGGIVTRINSVNNNVNAEIYNLAGQRVEKVQKGIYIMNGKKVLVK